MRIIITGGRHRTDYDSIVLAFEQLLSRGAIPASGADVTIVHGACPTGIDACAQRYADRYGYHSEPHRALWEQYGRAAGPKRNEQMAALGADLCLAYPSAKSKGTWDMIQRATKHGIKTIIIPEAQ